MSTENLHVVGEYVVQYMSGCSMHPKLTKIYKDGASVHTITDKENCMTSGELLSLAISWAHNEISKSKMGESL